MMGRKALQQYARVEKPKENKSRAVANSVAQSNNDKQAFQFVDNRQEAIAQRKLQEMANGSHVKHVAQLHAHAYVQGTNIHLAPSKEKHLPRESWHVVQQKQWRVKPTMQMKSQVNVNDDSGLEKEADVIMGAKAMNHEQTHDILSTGKVLNHSGVIQNKLYKTKAEKEPLTEEQIIALIDRLVGQYGDSNREMITELVRQYANDRYKRSIRDAEDFVRRNVTPDATRAVPLHFDESDRPMLPTGRTEIPIPEKGREPDTAERRAALRHMEFNSVTFLTAKVFLSDGRALVVELRNQDGRRNEGHAEMLLLGQISEYLSRFKGVESVKSPSQ